MAGGIYYISAGRHTMMYTLRHSYIESVGDYQAERDVYVCNLATDWQRALAKAESICRPELGKLLTIEEQFSLEQIRRKSEDDIRAAMLMREEERERAYGAKRAALLFDIERGVMPWGKHKGKMFTDLVAGERNYCEFISNSAPMDSESGAPEYVVFASNLIKDAFKKLLLETPDETACVDSHTGEIGKRQNFKAKVIHVAQFVTNYTYGGEKNLAITLKTEDGFRLVHKSPLYTCKFEYPDIGAEFMFSGIVKEHSEFRGNKQTRITNVKILG